MSKLYYTDAHIKTVSWKLCIIKPYSFRVFTHEICHLFDTFNSFNANIESFQTIYETDIL